MIEDNINTQRLPFGPEYYKDFGTEKILSDEYPSNNMKITSETTNKKDVIMKQYDLIQVLWVEDDISIINNFINRINKFSLYMILFSKFINYFNYNSII